MNFQIRNRSYKIISTFIFVAFCNFAIAQNNVVEIVKKCWNDSLSFEIALVGPSRILDSGRIELAKYNVRISNLELDALSEDEKVKLMTSLFSLLKDEKRDWYANVLLYQLTNRDASVLFVISTREKWIKGLRMNDYEYWKSKYKIPL